MRIRTWIIRIVCFVIVAALCILAALNNGASEGDSIGTRLINGFPVYFIGIFALVGMASLFESIATVLYRKIHCKYETDAICVDLVRRLINSSENNTRVVYKPVYEYEYEGETHHIESSVGMIRSAAPIIGSRAVIHMDEGRFEEFYINSPAEGLISKIITGVLFTLPSMGILIYIALSVLSAI